MAVARIPRNFDFKKCKRKNRIVKTRSTKQYKIIHGYWFIKSSENFNRRNSIIKKKQRYKKKNRNNNTEISIRNSLKKQSKRSADI